MRKPGGKNPKILEFNGKKCHLLYDNVRFFTLFLSPSTKEKGQYTMHKVKLSDSTQDLITSYSSRKE